MELSITIASYNTCEVTRDTLASIFAKTTDIEFEVIVVDNAWVDGSAEMIESQFPSVRLIRSQRNLGFAAAHNLALSHASGSCLLVLNSDVLFLDNAAKRMADDLRTAPAAAGVVGPQILNRDGTLAPSSRRRALYSRALVGISAVNQFFPFGHWLPMALIRPRLGRWLGRVHDNFDPPAVFQEIEWLNGMCVMFKREALEQTGLFDEQFFFDHEIGDLLLRARGLGWTIFFDPRIEVIHLKGSSRIKAPHLMVESKRGQLIYYAKHKPEYVPFLRREFLLLIWLKLLLMDLQFWGDRESWREKKRILEATRKAVAGFTLAAARENASIPRLERVAERV